MTGARRERPGQSRTPRARVPGLDRLWPRTLTRARLRERLRHVDWRRDGAAGVVLGVESVPDGLAGGLLAGVNPVWGLNSYLVGVVAGGVATSSSFMAVQATGAMAVVVADVPSVHTGTPEADTALFTLSVLTGLIMLGLGLARLGGLVRFVPHSVLTGFVSAVAVTIVLGQLDDLTGYASHGPNRLVKALDTALHVPRFAWGDVAVGVLTAVLIVVLERTRLRALGMVAAIALAAALAPAVGWIAGADIPVVADITTVPGGLPSLSLPSLGAVFSLLVPAASLAFVGLVQGAAVSSTVPNPDGRYPDPSGDFRGQGVANIASGLLQGMPVGGSMSGTALITGAGARSRAALLIAGATMGAVVLLFSDVVGYVPMPSLAALLLLVGAGSLRAERVLLVWHTGVVPATVMTTTFVLTILVPLQYAVLIGVGISVILHVVRQSGAVRVRRWVLDADGGVLETDPPAVLPGGEIVVLRPYGSLFFASAPKLEEQLPEVGRGSRGAAVVISLRGTEELGSTFITLVTRYAASLAEAGCLLVLTGVAPAVRGQLEKVGAAQLLGDGHVLDAEPTLLASTRRGVAAAEEWQRRGAAGAAREAARPERIDLDATAPDHTRRGS